VNKDQLYIICFIFNSLLGSLFFREKIGLPIWDQGWDQSGNVWDYDWHQVSQLCCWSECSCLEMKTLIDKWAQWNCVEFT